MLIDPDIYYTLGSGEKDKYIPLQKWGGLSVKNRLRKIRRELHFLNLNPTGIFAYFFV